MAKRKSIFVCQECGGEHPKWLGRCSSCGSWNSLIEEVRGGDRESFSGLLPSFGKKEGSPLPISQVPGDVEQRLSTGIGEFDRVVGGGLVPGSLTLLGGDPGIGKSTILLQAAAYFARHHGIVLYVSGEESPSQLKLRGVRLDALEEDLLVVGETDLISIIEQITHLQPSLVILDSIQTTYFSEISAAPGSVSQVRECTFRLLNLANSLNIPIIIVGHVTKEGVLAGPRVLEHMVDIVLYLEGERHHIYRILRGVKNRYGSTNEIGIFEMGERGLREVNNPSELFLAQRPTEAAGSIVIATLEGTRPLLVEVQALVSPSGFGVPRRSGTGIDYNRLVMLLAVLEKREGLNIANQDVYVNAVGGVRIEEPAADLGIAVALASSYRGISGPEATVVFGEVGLTGEVRMVSRLEQRLKEAAKLGFSQCILPRGNVERLEFQSTLNLLPVGSVGEALKLF